jgi:hypothetical protein
LWRRRSGNRSSHFGFGLHLFGDRRICLLGGIGPASWTLHSVLSPAIYRFDVKLERLTTRALNSDFHKGWGLDPADPWIPDVTTPKHAAIVLLEALMSSRF